MPQHALTKMGIKVCHVQCLKKPCPPLDSAAPSLPVTVDVTAGALRRSNAIENNSTTAEKNEISAEYQ
eukprot:CAMPEP_0113612504 /NCGR_PEP_ID=MMETSP0017_2-20120614/6135_1 /TAXON_ID=2856 /ORGANISM="Cylindrotheca closterium" /LENGTH=67 /DNA_ID=CAMNT_0000521543 /DNA_START=279 /DNA_END=482 /DNA_ORIENTATION=- /assembly_acc=CAM_ASM_000147